MPDTTYQSINGNFPSCRQVATTYDGVANILQTFVDGTWMPSTYAQLTDYFKHFFTDTQGFVVDVMYFPCDIDTYFLTTIDITSSGVPVGTYSIKLTSAALTTTKLKQVVSTTDIKKWFTFTPTRVYNNFLDFAPFTKFTLFVPFFEKFDLNPQMIYGHTVDGYLAIDTLSGMATCFIYLDETILLDSHTCKLGISVPVGKSNKDEQNRNNLLQSISIGGSIVGLGVGAYTGNPLITAGSVGMLTGNITKYMQNNIDRLVSYKGGSGNRDGVSVDKSIRLCVERPKSYTQPNAHLRGRMMNANATLNTLTGFTQIGEIHFEPKGYDIYGDEISEIVELLKTGVVL